MANPRPAPHTATLKIRKLPRTILIIILALIFLAALVVFIIWLSVKPKHIVYTIEDASIYGYNLANNRLNATFNFVVRAHNPNTKISIYYDKLEASVAYDDQTITSNTLLPFYQPHKNVTLLWVKLVVQDAAIGGGVERDLRRERASGEVKVDVRMKAKVRLKLGVLKSGHRTLRVWCSPTLVPFSSSGNFQRVYCDVDL